MHSQSPPPPPILLLLLLLILMNKVVVVCVGRNVITKGCHDGLAGYEGVEGRHDEKVSVMSRCILPREEFVNKVLRVNVGHFMACTTFAVRSWGGHREKNGARTNK